MVRDCMGRKGGDEVAKVSHKRQPRRLQKRLKTRHGIDRHATSIFDVFVSFFTQSHCSSRLLFLMPYENRIKSPFSAKANTLAQIMQILAHQMMAQDLECKCTFGVLEEILFLLQ